MKSTLLSASVAIIVMHASSARADWNFFDNDNNSSSSSSSISAEGNRKGPPILPTASIAIGLDPGTKAQAYGNFLLGASHYPFGTAWSPFYSAALEMDLRSVRDKVGNTRTVPTFGPQIRGGISYFPDSNGFLSVFNAYGLVGYRAPSGFEGHAFRFGVGISSPGVGIMIMTARLVLPWMIEGTCDVTALGIRPSVRFGFSY